MYRCDGCKQISQPKESCNIIQLETRPKVYFDDTGAEIARGFETVRVGRFCTACAKKMNAPKEETNELKA
jgi:hypothetical protein